MSQAILQVARAAEIYLLPGDFHFGGGDVRIHTVLGSCVSIAVWHPVLRIGGMSHSLLPSRCNPANHDPDGHYADEAVELLLRETAKRGTRPAEYRVRLIGGGNMFRQFFREEAFNVAGSNVEAARILLEAAGFGIHAEHVGGNGHRNIVFDLRDGRVSVRHVGSTVNHEAPIPPRTTGCCP